MNSIFIHELLFLATFIKRLALEVCLFLISKLSNSPSPTKLKGGESGNCIKQFHENSKKNTLDVES